MPMPKYKIGERIKIKDQFNEYVEGHIVLIMNSLSDDREYYCSMYPGAMPNYHYVECADLSMNLLDDGKIYILHALNKFTEDQLEYVDGKKIRKFKLKKIEKNQNEII